MAVSGLPEACENHAKWIAKLALDMMDMAKYVQMGTEPVVSKHEITPVRSHTRSLPLLYPFSYHFIYRGFVLCLFTSICSITRIHFVFV